MASSEIVIKNNVLISCPKGIDGKLDLSGYTFTEVAPFVFTSEHLYSKVILSPDCQKIHNKAFYYNETIHTLQLGEKTEDIGIFAIAGGNHITSFDIPSENAVYTAIEGCIYTKDEKTLVLGANKTSLEIPKGTESISERAFSYCSNLKEISFPSTLTTLGAYCFSDCESLETITIPKTISCVGYGAFFGCDNLQIVTLEGASEAEGSEYGVKELLGLSFGGLPQLRLVYIPSSLSKIGRVIGEETFSGNKSTLTFGLTENRGNYNEDFLDTLPTSNIISISDTVEVVCHLGFKTYTTVVLVGSSYRQILENAEDALKNQYVNVIFGWYKDEDFSIQVSDTDIVSNYEVINGEVVIVPRVDIYAHYQGVNFTITLNPRYEGGEQQTITAQYATKLVIGEEYIPYRVMYMFDGWYADYDYTEPLTVDGVTTVNVEGNTTIYAKWVSQASTYKIKIISSSSKTVSLVEVLDWDRVFTQGTVIEIPKEIEGVDEEDNVITYSVIEVGNNLYENSDKVTKIVIPSSIRTIGVSAMANCSALKEIEFLKGSRCTTINAKAFEGTALTSITLPDSVARIRQGVFNKCGSLASVTFGTGLKEIGTESVFNYGTFNECYALQEVKIDSITHWLNISFGYGGCNPLSMGSSILKVKDTASGTGYTSVTSLGAEEFAGITQIKDYAFTGYGSLTSVDISSSSIWRIGKEAFSACIMLGEVELGSSELTTIGDTCFSYCFSLTSISIPGTVKSPGAFMFNTCPLLSNITLQDGLLYISTAMFSSCPSIKHIIVPNSVIGIGSSAFSACSGLEVVAFNSSTESRCTIIDTYAFFACSNLKLVCCLEGQEFDESNLPEANFPDSLVTIGNNAFDKCHSSFITKDSIGDWHDSWLVEIS